MNQRFYLSDLGDHKAIFGYPWFTAFQPRVDWKRGWIDMSQLPIILSAPNAAKAMYTPRTKNVPQPIRKISDQYFLGRVTIGSTNSNEPNSTVPKEYQRHSKVFSEAESQRLPQSTVWDHAIKLLLEHWTPFQEDYSHSPRKKKRKCTNLYKNTSKEGQSVYPNHPMQPISSL